MEAAATDSELVDQSRQGNPQAFTTLVERHFGLVYAVAYAHVGHRETAEDLAQEVFLRSYLYLASLQNPARFPQWLVQIAHNLAKNWHRGNARAARLVTMVPIDDADEEAAMAEESRAGEAMASDENAAWLNEAILKLPQEQREAVLLHYTEGLSQKEIADRLAVHPSTIGRHLKQALKALQHSLEPLLKTTAPALKPRKSTVARTVAILGAAAAMSAQSKLALAVAGGGAAWIASVSAPTASTAGPIVGFLKSISTALFSGGKIMVISKLVAVAVVGVSLVVGGNHVLEQKKLDVNLASRAQAADTTTVVAQNTAPVEVQAIPQDEKNVQERFQKAKEDMRTMASAIESYYIDCNKYPLSSSDPSSNLYASFGSTSPMANQPTFTTLGKTFMLTTPIAYIASVPSDPFAPAKGAPFCYYADPTGASWISWSAGPDQKYDLTAKNIVDILDPRNPNMAAHPALLSLTFDPTNGTRSAGDVWRVKQ